MSTQAPRTSRGAPAVDVAPGDHLSDLVVDAARRDPSFPLIRRRDEGGRWSDISASQFLLAAQHLARGLADSGVGVGDRVALMSHTRYEWTLVDVALWFTGAVGVPVYETSSAQALQWVLADSGAVACVVETAEHARLVASVRDQTPDLRVVWTIDEGDLDVLAGATDDAAGAGNVLAEEDVLLARRARAGRDDLATIIYTSGTTGRPKGVRLTHGNFLALARGAVRDVPEVFADQSGACLLFLPLAHVFARFVQVLCLASPMTLGHTPGTSTLVEDLATFRPTFVLAVPRVFEKLFSGAEQKATAAGRGRLFERAVEVAVRTSRAQESARSGGAGPGLLLRAQHAVFDRLVYAKIRSTLGGRASWAISGGGPLGERLGHFFRGSGTVVLQGWGMTETSAPTTVNRPRQDRVTTVGTPLPGCAVRVGSDGEVLVAGPHVSPGYWGAGRSSDADAFCDVEGERWMRTGDLGRVDDDGHLRITGRLKELLVTSSGKNVSPAVLEDGLRSHPLISQAIVVGDARPYIGALVTLDAQALPGWLSAHSRPALDVAGAARDDAVLAAVQQAVERANAAVSRAESIRRVRILDRDFTEESGHLTPSLKLRRAAVLAEVADDVEALYRD